MALLKSTQLTERVNLQFRAELYNVFNHAQFLTPNGIITYSPTTLLPNPNTMGQVPGTTPGRIGQLSLKLNF
jgi:hypothetical protein